MRDILIATSNPGKFREIISVLMEGGDATRAGPIRWLSLRDLGRTIPEPEETGATFAENAAIKAAYYSRVAGSWTLADDSGLVVDALRGEPGVHSARYSGLSAANVREAVDAANNAKLVKALAGVPDERRTARFCCALALTDGPQIIATAEGSIEGRIVDEPRGTGGFGYDPHFFVDSLGRTTAELSATEKNRVSHRGQALQAFRKRLAALTRP